MSRRLRITVLVVALGGAVTSIVLWSIDATPVAAETPLAVAVAELAISLLYVATGVVASTRPPSRRVGWMLAGAGLTLLVGLIGVRIDNALFFTAGMIGQGLFIAVLAHTAVVYPTGRVQSTFDRLVVVAAYAVILVQAPLEDVARRCRCPDNLLLLPLRPDVLDVAVRTSWAATLPAIAVFVIALVRHYREGTQAARRVLLPVVVTAVVMAGAHAGLVAVGLGAPLGADWGWTIVIMIATASVPIAYLAARLRSYLAGSGVSRLVVELGDAPPPGQLRAALARALNDTTVDVAYWARDRACYIDADGHQVTLPTDPVDRAVTVLEQGGLRVGALVHDPALADEPTLVEAVCAAAGLALENERLHAEVRARLEEVQASRARIVEAADAERQRVERNLHDGAQQRLVTLSLALRMARSRLGPDQAPAVDGLLEEATGELQRALEELRELACGLHPAILAEEGLEAALDTLAERAPLPVDVDVRAPERLPPAVEVATYFLVSEALANAAKHARASMVTVRAERQEGHLRVEVVDDGVGGATVRRRSGLEGLGDRVAAVGGRLWIESPPGGGTTLTAEIPCE